MVRVMTIGCQFEHLKGLLGLWGGKNVLAERIPAKPTHAIQLILLRVWMLAKPKPATHATATKIAVHAPCSDNEFSPMEIPSIPEPATHVQTVVGQFIVHDPSFHKVMTHIMRTPTPGSHDQHGQRSSTPHPRCRRLRGA
jgi:hypothetical protein